jgi:HAD superfamily hydrolase (TIGR01509 family)
VLPAALVFDFDGLVCDTETLEYESVRRVFADHGADLPLSDWLPAVGLAEPPEWPAALESAVGRPLDRAELAAARRAHGAILRAELAALPGVGDLLAEAHTAGVPCGLASNSPREWVAAHLAHVGLATAFDAIVTVEDVSRPKPDPEPYRVALALLGAPAAASVALEDSATGVLAARRAGLYTVAVPGPMSAHHDFSAAELVVPSLAEVTLVALGAALATRGYS